MKRYVFAATVVLTLMAPMTARGQLYMEDFDADHSANWLLSANEGFGQSPSDGVGEPDKTADFFFDYSDVGIPSAPNSAGGTTRGMKIQANLIAGIFGGASASPIGQSFTGDYKVTFDLWGNYVGDPTLGLNPGGQGQSVMSTYGILTDGATGVVPGVNDAVWFAATVEGGSGADFRAYSIEREISYQIPPVTTVLDGVGEPVDSHATHHALSRNNVPPPADYNDNGIMDAADYVIWRKNDGLSTMAPDPAPPRTSGNGDFDRDVDEDDYEMWAALFGSRGLYIENFGGVAAPAAQLAEYPQQTGTTPLGSIGMEWHEVEIAKVGNIVTWTMDGALLITLDMTNFTEQPDGTNIFFGHSDINAGSSLEPDRFDLQFSLFDNVKVTDLSVVGAGSSGAVPEPGTFAGALLGLLLVGAGFRRHR
ncbi:MAG: PEP-CTERM sorting domain-containing protein [Pirellulales bacterium]